MWEAAPSLKTDRSFDKIFPPWVRDRSLLHWTPVRVALRATEWLTSSRPDARVLDVGSGPGKFCLIGALATPGAVFHGVEQRPHLVALARELARRYRVARVEFFVRNFVAWDWGDYDGVYLFNPFEENRAPERCIDSTVPLGMGFYREYVQAVHDRLEAMREGTRVVTYHGFGGSLPASYVLARSERCERGPLELWIRSG